MTRPLRPCIEESVMRTASLALMFLIVAGCDDTQIVPAIPGGTPAPVVPKLPDIVQYLRECKSLCEGRAEEVKANSRRRMRPRLLARGERLYNDAKVQFDGCISYLQTALSRRFNDDDPAKILKSLNAASRKMDLFIGWYDTPKETEGCCAAAGPGDWVGPTLDFISGWINGVRQENEAAINRIHDDLEACRFRDWNQL
jgi:hypothetical protein